jgi:hypothetical protein
LPYKSFTSLDNFRIDILHNISRPMPLGKYTVRSMSCQRQDPESVFVSDGAFRIGPSERKFMGVELFVFVSDPFGKGKQTGIAWRCRKECLLFEIGRFRRDTADAIQRNPCGTPEFFSMVCCKIIRSVATDLLAAGKNGPDLGIGERFRFQFSRKAENNPEKTVYGYQADFALKKCSVTGVNPARDSA